MANLAGRRLRLATHVFVALALVGGVSACGDDADAQRLREEQLARARAEGVRQARIEERTRQAAETARQLRRELDKLKKSSRRRSRASGSSIASTARSATAGNSCGGGLSVNSVTTCPFAENVRSAYYGSGQAGVIDVHSPVTDRTYTMSCSSGTLHVCTGGNGARVSFP
jgi:hypothetical protein